MEETLSKSAVDPNTRALVLRVLSPTDWTENARAARTKNDIEGMISTDIFDDWNSWSALAYRIASDQCAFKWSRKIFKEVVDSLNCLYFDTSDKSQKHVLETFFLAFQTLRQTLPIMGMLQNGFSDKTTETRMCLLPLYTSLAEASFKNTALCILGIVGRTVGKSYHELNDLQPIIDALEKNGFENLASLTDAGLRNAISHGGVIVTQNKTLPQIIYRYKFGSEWNREIISQSTLKHDVVNCFEGVSAAILAICVFLNSHRNEISFELVGDGYLRQMYYGFNLSSSLVLCSDAFEAINKKQITYTFETSITDKIALFWLTEKLLEGVYTLDPSYGAFSISYMNPRMMANFIRVEKKDIETYRALGCPSGYLIDKAKRNSLWFDPSDEEINVDEASYYCIPEYENGNLKITDVTDISNDETAKRFRATVFVGEVDDKEKLVELLKKALDWVKNLFNPPALTHRIKHGDMPADWVYLTVYCDELDDNRALLQNNKNFICELAYSNDISNRYEHNNKLIRYLEGNVEVIDDETTIYWRDRKYVTAIYGRKIGRNELCPCGSGKKFKKCCGRN